MKYQTCAVAVVSQSLETGTILGASERLTGDALTFFWNSSQEPFPLDKKKARITGPRGG